MTQHAIKDAKRLCSERPTKQWWMPKRNYPFANWGDVAAVLTEEGYLVQDQGDLVLVKQETQL